MADFSEIITEINTNLPDNNTQAITAKKLRDTMIDLTNAIEGQQNNFEVDINEEVDGLIQTATAATQNFQNTIVNSLSSTATTAALSANNGKKLKEYTMLNDYHYYQDPVNNLTQLTDFDYLPSGTTIVNYGCALRIYDTASTYVTIQGRDKRYGGWTYVTTADTTVKIVTVIGNGLNKADFVINPSTERMLTENVIQDTTPFQEEIVIKEGTVTATAGTTLNIVATADGYCNIAVGTELVFEILTPGVIGTGTTNIIKDYTIACAVGESTSTSSWKSDVKEYRYEFTNNKADKIGVIRVTVPSSHVIGSGDIKFRLAYRQNFKSTFDKMVEHFADKLTLDEIIAYAKRLGMWDEDGQYFKASADGFHTITFEGIHDADTMGMKQMMAAVFAKHTCDPGYESSFPYITVQVQPTSNQGPYPYMLGEENGFYKYTECVATPLIKSFDNTGTTFQNQTRRIQIYIPDHVQLYIKYFNYTPVGPKTQGFKLFHHTSDYRQDMCCPSNWQWWKWSNPYGSIVVPKKTVDGVWVTFHDDGKMGSNSTQMEMLDGSALTSDIANKTCNQLTYAETQSIRYKVVNWWGEHPMIGKLEDFFAECAIQGIHPCLSIHPSWSVSEYAEIKALSDKYSVTDKLTIKGSLEDPSSTGTTNGNRIFQAFGNTIESYFPDARITTGYTTVLDRSGFDKTKVVLGVECILNGTEDGTPVASGGTPITYGWIPSAEIRQYYEENGYKWGFAPDDGTNLLDPQWIRKAFKAGMYEMTNDSFFGNGTNF